MSDDRPLLGLIVNPVAGIGGPLALKGSDDSAAVAQALARGAARVAPARAARALRVVRTHASHARVFAPEGAMGADPARGAGFDVTALAHKPRTPTSAADTRAAAAELVERGADLIVFAGGDGTARDVASVVGTEVPMIGVPAGVKMRSAVFGTTPEAAGEAAGRFLGAPAQFGLADGEVLDAPDAGLESELFALARVPDVPGRLQRGKAAPPRDGGAALGALAAAMARELERGRTYLFGPGTTTGRILHELGLPATPLGVDAVRDGALIGRDLDEDALLTLLENGAPATLVLGVIGGQGFLLGRGNQQLSARVLRAIGPDNVVIVAGADKVQALDPPVLHVDLGGDGENQVFAGYRRVHVAPGRSIVMRVTG